MRVAIRSSLGGSMPAPAADLMEVSSCRRSRRAARQIPVDEGEDTMFAFAVMALLGLAVLAVTAIVGRYL
ncbi:MAG TPA: hypothetical protein VFV73_25870 [Streptosporangiaceae bacterium]|nr:hypothetical protein [Streptosporangiaceae bacterium]